MIAWRWRIMMTTTLNLQRAEDGRNSREKTPENEVREMTPEKVATPPKPTYPNACSGMSKQQEGHPLIDWG